MHWNFGNWKYNSKKIFSDLAEIVLEDQNHLLKQWHLISASSMTHFDAVSLYFMHTGNMYTTTSNTYPQCGCTSLWPKLMLSFCPEFESWHVILSQSRFGLKYQDGCPKQNCIVVAPPSNIMIVKNKNKKYYSGQNRTLIKYKSK